MQSQSRTPVQVSHAPLLLPPSTPPPPPVLAPHCLPVSARVTPEGVGEGGEDGGVGITAGMAGVLPQG